MLSIKVRKKLTSDAKNSSTGKTIQTLINSYYYFEKQCDEVMDQLEQRKNEIFARVDREVLYRNSGLHPEECPPFDAPTPAALVKTSLLPAEVGKEEFCSRVQLAQKFCIPYRIMKGSRLINGATDAELTELEDLEVRIQLYQYQLREIENEILQKIPEDADNALLKLKFISALLIDGFHMDIDYFAYLVKECSEQCQNDLRSIRHAYKEHEKHLR